MIATCLYVKEICRSNKRCVAMVMRWDGPVERHADGETWLGGEFELLPPMNRRMANEPKEWQV